MIPCPLNVSTETLSAYYAHLLQDNEQAALEAHVADCAACRYHLAAFDRIRQALRGHRSPVDAQTVWRQLNGRIAIHRGGFMLQSQKIAWLSGVALLAVVIIAFAAIFAFRNPQTTPPVTSASPTPTVTATATAAPTATATATPEPTLTAQQLAACFGSGYPQSEIARIGDIALQSSAGLAFPSRALPEGTASPYKLIGNPSTNFAPSFVGDADPLMIPFEGNQNPYNSTIYFQICNLSTSTTYHINQVVATISRFTPYSGSLNVWVPPPCVSTYYSSAARQVIGTGGCGGAYGPLDIHASATFPSGSTTGTVALGVVSADSATTLAPGKSLAGLFDLTLPATPGTYRLAPNLTIDSGAHIDGAPGAPYLYAPVAHVWDGKACANVSIPASPPANYICRN